MCKHNSRQSGNIALGAPEIGRTAFLSWPFWVTLLNRMRIRRLIAGMRKLLLHY